VEKKNASDRGIKGSVVDRSAKASVSSPKKRRLKQDPRPAKEKARKHQKGEAIFPLLRREGKGPSQYDAGVFGRKKKIILRKQGRGTYGVSKKKKKRASSVPDIQGGKHRNWGGEILSD